MEQTGLPIEKITRGLVVMNVGVTAGHTLQLRVEVHAASKKNVFSGISLE